MLFDPMLLTIGPISLSYVLYIFELIINIKYWKIRMKEHIIIISILS